MTRKHFESLAALMRLWRVNTKTDRGLDELDWKCRQLAAWCSSHNPRFDKERFLKACGVPEE